MNILNIYSDGGARGNPGPAGIGFVIYRDKEKFFDYKEYIGEQTNNVAEYLAIKKALEYILFSEKTSDQINCYLDSELVVKQLSGIYKVKKAHLREIYINIINTIGKIKNKNNCQINFFHIPRAQNTEADSLVNQAVDEYLSQI